MGKPSGSKKRMRKKFNYDVNRKKLWKKQNRLPNIKCDQVREAWSAAASVQVNLKRMGLASDPNKALPIPNAKQLLMDSDSKKKKAFKPFKGHVVEELEAIASIPHENNFRVSEKLVQFATYMMEKYGEDYKAMAKDLKNYYQYTPKHIKNIIKKFKKATSQYNAYLSVKMDTN